MVAAPASLDTLCINSIRMLAVDAIKVMESKKITALPVVDAEHRLAPQRMVEMYL